MNRKIKKLFTNWRIILLLLFVFGSLLAINPDLSPKGVSITFVGANSSADTAGISLPEQGTKPRSYEIIYSMNGNDINGLDDYYSTLDEISKLQPYDTIQIRTNIKDYFPKLQPIIDVEVTAELETVTVNKTEKVYFEANDTYESATSTYEGYEIFTDATGTFINKILQEEITRNKTIEHILGVEDIGLKVIDAPFSNIQKGLDLAGGTRVILEPEANTSDEDFSTLITQMTRRIDVYGLSNIKPKPIFDLTGKRYIMVEVPGASQEEVKSLVMEQGVFEAKVMNVTVFTGDKGIKNVRMGGEGVGLDPFKPCSQVDDELYSCRYRFGIILSQEAAEKQAEETSKLGVITVNDQGQVIPKEDQYLDQKLDFYLDGHPTESLNIGADLKGRAITDIQISGSGIGSNPQEAQQITLDNMRKMQTLLKTGSLPVTVNLTKTDTISASLGKEFLNNAILVGFVALLAVVLIMFIVYKKIHVVVPIILTILSEMIILLGFAAYMNWKLDMAAIAGIIIVIGTGVDHLIIITDEALKKSSEVLTWLQKLKRAFSIIFVAGLTTFSAMVPLYFAGAGLLRGFAITTMVGVGIGVLLARPAYSSMIEIMLKK